MAVYTFVIGRQSFTLNSLNLHQLLSTPILQE